MNPASAVYSVLMIFSLGFTSGGMQVTTWMTYLSYVMNVRCTAKRD